MSEAGRLAATRSPEKAVKAPSSRTESWQSSVGLADLEQRDPALLDWVCRFAERVLFPYHRAEVSGLDHIPAGPALFVGNHSGGVVAVDTVLFGAAVIRAHGIDGLPFGLAHEVPLRVPGLDRLMARIGAVRASDENAGRLFQAGKKVLVYPGGDLDTLRPFSERNRIVFGGRRGYVRTALRHGVPILPVVSAGSHSTFIVLSDLRWLARLLRSDRWLRLKVWPLVLSFPWGLTLGPPPPHLPFPSRIRIEVTAPIRFDRSGPGAADDEAYVKRCAAEVEAVMQATLDRLAGTRPRRERPTAGWRRV